MNLLYQSLVGTDGASEYWIATAQTEPHKAVASAIELLHNCSALFSELTEHQSADCLRGLIDPSRSKHVDIFFEQRIEPQIREFLGRSISNVFISYFANQVPSECISGKNFVVNPLSRLCYMWWDLFPFRPIDNFGDLGKGLSHCLVSSLYSANEAVRESALHGIAKWSTYRNSDMLAFVQFVLRLDFPGDTHERIAFALKTFGLYDDVL